MFRKLFAVILIVSAVSVASAAPPAANEAFDKHVLLYAYCDALASWLGLRVDSSGALVTTSSAVTATPTVNIPVDQVYAYLGSCNSYLASVATNTPTTLTSFATISTYPALITVSGGGDFWWSGSSNATAAWLWKCNKWTSGSAPLIFRIKQAGFNPSFIASSTGTVIDLNAGVYTLTR